MSAEVLLLFVLIQTNWGRTMADAFVFNLMKPCGEGYVKDMSLRYAYDERITVERGDVWQREDTEGNITGHQVMSLRVFETVNGTEYHSYLVPEMKSVERII